MRLIAFVLLIAISGLAVAEEVKNRDGNWWQRQSEMARTYYVLGMLDGMTLGHNLGSAVASVDKDAVDKVNSAYGQAVAKYLNNVTVKQLMDGMTSIYADYKNRRITTDGAMWLVMLGISGAPQALLDTATEQFRQASTPAAQ
jgi:hypothetical protein